MNIWQNKKWGPMLLEEIERPFNSNDYLFEIKFDGHRTLIFASPHKVIIQSRNLIDVSYLYPELQFLKKLVKKETIFDGEIVYFENGKPNFGKLQERAHLKNVLKIKEASLNSPIVFVCFDILYEGKDLTKEPLLKRKEILNKYPDNDIFMKTKYIEGEGIKLFKEVKKANLEGIIAKRKNSEYLINTRCDNWIKIKNYQVASFLVGGYEDISKNYVVTLYLGEYQNNELHLIGKVNMAKKNPLYSKLQKLKTLKNSPFTEEFPNINYLKPTIMVQVKYIERTKSNNLRQPIFIKEEKKK